MYVYNLLYILLALYPGLRDTGKLQTRVLTLDSVNTLHTHPRDVGFDASGAVLAAGRPYVLLLLREGGRSRHT